MKSEKEKGKRGPCGVGIDSGGTFTDGVILDLATGIVLKKVKVRTTHNHLLTGIRNCLCQLETNKYNISALSLSTTLATNSVVEGKGADVGVFLVGQKSMGEIPSAHCFHIAGGHDSMGNPLGDLDIAGAKKHIEEIKNDVSAFAISAIMSVRNPEHELALKKFIVNNYNIPVICGHELTSTLGAHERAVTATLNARLIPVIKELIMAVKQTMEEEQIDAPLMLVRGDGSLVLAETALDRPIETMLSGPAASIIGAKYLTSLQNAIVTDMGGTTTDTAMIRDGLPLVNPDGATVGGFLTRVKAVNIHTVGLGGDSHIKFHEKEGIEIGPQRVVPVSVAALENKHIIEELRVLLARKYRSARYQPVEFLFLTKKGKNSQRISKEIKGIMENGSHSIFYISQQLSIIPEFLALDIDKWKKEGLISTIGLTPTDLKVAMGDVNIGLREAAELGVGLTCQVFSLTKEELFCHVDHKINQNICSILIDEVMGNKSILAESKNFFLVKLFDNTNENYDLSLKLKIPVIAVGAPVEAYFPNAMQVLDSELVIPEHSEVANAVGAITGQIVEQVELLIRPESAGFTLYTPWEKYSYPDTGLEELKDIATEMGKKYVLEQAEKNGGHNIEVFCEVKDVKVGTVLSSEQLYFLEGRVMAKAIGNAYRGYLE